MAKKQNEQNPFEKMTFEQAIETLGEIVRKIETGQVPLQESLRQYEQGMALIGHCRTILLDAEKRIELIGEGPKPLPSAEADPDDVAESGVEEEADEDDSLF